MLFRSTYSQDHEFEINPFDQKIGIKWGMDVSDLKISDKDRDATTLAERLVEGKLP